MQTATRRPKTNYFADQDLVQPQGLMMSNFRTVFGAVLVLAAATLGLELAAAPANISTFPYTPNDTAEATDFEANYGSGPTASGSTWTHGSVSSPRKGSTGSGDSAWAVLPSSEYVAGTDSWLHSPIFDFTGESGLELAFEMWMQTRDSKDGMKLQVSDDGGASWSDVSTQSVAYTGTVNVIDDEHGGSTAAWEGNSENWSTDAVTCIVNLSPWAGESDVRFRWCFSSRGGTPGEEGPVIDSPRIQAVTSSIAYSGGYTAVPQGATVTATVTKTSGDDFTSTGMTVVIDGVGVTGGNISFTSVDEIDVDFTATRTADVGPHTYKIKDSGATSSARARFTCITRNSKSRPGKVVRHRNHHAMARLAQTESTSIAASSGMTYRSSAFPGA